MKTLLKFSTNRTRSKRGVRLQFVRILLLLYIVVPALPALAMNQPAPDEPRAALVIGNGSYHNGPLRNPVNDARAVAEKLEKLGFKVVLRENATREGMHQAISEFGGTLKSGGVGLFFYAGHGMQIKGRNFLIPVDADIQSEDDIEFRGVDANMVLARMDGAHSRVNLMVLDACRNNPFNRNNRSANPGLAQMDAPKGTLIAFSTAPGSLAKDGGGANSIYTKHLLEYLSTPAVPVEQVFKEVRVAVAHETQDKQIPWESSSLMGEFYFVPPSSAFKPVTAVATSAPKAEQPQLASRSQTIPPTQKPPAAEKQPKPKSAEVSGRNYNREGYEIEIKAKTLTEDELPALEARAQGGDAIAQTTLGWAYLLGKGAIDGRNIPRNNSRMVQWTLAAAKQGYPVAQNNMGAMYMDGVGVKMDFPKAQYYFKLAADQGYLTAQRNLLHVTTMLDRKPDMKQLQDLVKGVQQQFQEPVR